MYGYPRIKDKFFELTEEKPQIIINNLVDSCDKWRNGVIQEDDITFLVIKVK
jgi:serine phosphatase RsbU (regulator of sigma subunit)